MIYWITFTASAGFMYVARRGKKAYKNLALFMSLGLLVLLAALRSTDVGRDISTYLRPLFNVANNSNSVAGFLSTCKMTAALRDVESGFLIIVFLVTKVTHSINFVFFAIELLIVLPTYIAIDKFALIMKDKGLKYSLPMAIFTFCGLFYCYYLSAMRQGIACSFVLLSVVYWLNAEKKKSIISIIIAFFMHQSGIFGVGLILIYTLCSKKHSRRTNIFIVIGILFALFYNRIFPVIMGLLQRVGLVSSKYIGWQTNAYYSSDIAGGVNYASLICTIYILLIAYLIFRKYKSAVSIFLFVTSFLALCLTPFIARYPTFGRVNVYFQELSILILPLASSALYRISKSDRKIIGTTINLLFIVAYWIVTVVVAGSTDTAIYSFFWQ